MRWRVLLMVLVATLALPSVVGELYQLVDKLDLKQNFSFTSLDSKRYEGLTKSVITLKGKERIDFTLGDEEYEAVRVSDYPKAYLILKDGKPILDFKKAQEVFYFYLLQRDYISKIRENAKILRKALGDAEVILEKLGAKDPVSFLEEERDRVSVLVDMFASLGKREGYETALETLIEPFRLYSAFQPLRWFSDLTSEALRISKKGSPTRREILFGALYWANFDRLKDMVTRALVEIESVGEGKVEGLKVAVEDLKISLAVETKNVKSWLDVVRENGLWDEFEDSVFEGRVGGVAESFSKLVYSLSYYSVFGKMRSLKGYEYMKMEEFIERGIEGSETPYDILKNLANAVFTKEFIGIISIASPIEAFKTPVERVNSEYGIYFAIEAYIHSLKYNRKPVLLYVFPKNGTTIEGGKVTLVWKAEDPDGDDVVYDVYFGLIPLPPLIKEGYTGNSITVEVDPKYEKYYWKIVARDSKGAENEGPVWVFYVK